VCFLDADTRLRPGALDRLVRTQAERGGLVSACPWHDVERPYERLSAFCNLVALMGTDAHTPLRRRPVGAYGPVLVVAAEDYRRLGGHGGVRGDVLDDLGLAARWRAAGLPVHLYADGVATYRMYPGGLRELADGWTKNLAAGAGSIRVTTLLAVVVWLSLPIQAAAGLVAALAGLGSLAWALVAYGLVVAELAWLLRRVGRFGPLTALAYPVPLVAFLGLLARSGLRLVTGRPTRWKGRAVPARRVRPGG
jgi:4,4'-diaponeurosporenoate glycosyltransferase